MGAALLEVKAITKLFGRPAHAAVRPVVDEVTLSISEGEKWGLLGESGAGKTTFARMLAGPLKPTSGTILYRGQPIESMTRRQKQEWLLGVQLMFEHPDAALNPRLHAMDIISDAPLTHRLFARDMASRQVADLMEEVGLDPARARSYPHEFLPQERHRIALARALAVRPSLLICDQFARTLPPEDGDRLLDLVMERCVARGIACLIVSDRMAEIEERCEHVAILCRGQLLEVGPAAILRDVPSHPYTQVQFVEQRSAHVSPAPQAMPGYADVESGCIFQPGCRYAGSRCRHERPCLRTIAPGHSSACHLNDASGAEAAGRAQR